MGKNETFARSSLTARFQGCSGKRLTTILGSTVQNIHEKQHVRIQSEGRPRSSENGEWINYGQSKLAYLSRANPSFLSRSTMINRRPKVELHAHLNGSIWPERLWALKAAHQRRFPQDELPVFPPWFDPTISADRRRILTFDDVFPLFGVVQALTDHPEGVAQAVRGVVADFQAEGVRYLELRSTPR